MNHLPTIPELLQQSSRMTEREQYTLAHCIIEHLHGQNDDASNALHDLLHSFDRAHKSTVAAFEDEYGNPHGAEAGRNRAQEMVDYRESVL